MPSFIIDKSGTKETKLTKQNSRRGSGLSRSSHHGEEKATRRFSLPRLSSHSKNNNSNPDPCAAKVVAIRQVDQQKLVTLKLAEDPLPNKKKAPKHATLEDGSGKRHTDVQKGTFHVVSTSVQDNTLNVIVENDRGNPNSMASFLFQKARVGTPVLVSF